MFGISRRLVLLLLLLLLLLLIFRGSRTHNGVDVLCDAGADIYAPIDGVINLSIPYGDGSCCDDGFNIQGSGAWSGKITNRLPL